MNITVIIHTYNSEKYLKECLESVKQADEIIICDMYSTDNTVNIAQEYNCRIIYHENIGWADPARNFAISHATNEWILVVDSDETIPTKLLDYLNQFKEQKHDYIAVCIPRKNLFLRKFMHCVYPNTILRFFKKGCLNWRPYVHCTPEIRGLVYTIDAKRDDLAIIHYNYDSISDYISRTNKYTSLELEKLAKRNKNFSLTLMFLRPLGEFIKRYILKKGFKDGIQGLIFALLLSFYEFIQICKLYEKELFLVSLSKEKQ